MIDILVVDDHPVVGEGIKICLAGEPDMRICGVVKTEEGLWRAVAEARPDLVIMDVWLGPSDGLLLTESMRWRYPEVPVLVYSMANSVEYVHRALTFGARGYVTKDRAVEELVPAIRHILAGHTYVSEPLERVLAEHGLSGGRTVSPPKGFEQGRGPTRG